MNGRSTEPDPPFDVSQAPAELQDALRRMSARGRVMELGTGAVVAEGGHLISDGDPRTTLRALVDKLAGLLEVNPEWGDFEVQLGQACEPFTAGWSGKTFAFVAARTFELETNEERYH